MEPFISHLSALGILFVFVLFAPVRIVAQAAPDSAQMPTAKAAAPSAPNYRLKLPVPLVIEEVVVLDSKEQPVRGCKPQTSS
jgi:hypothetical protein